MQNQLLTWVSWLQKEYNVDGYRIDTIPEVPKWFWTKFNHATNTYAVGECFDNRTDFVAGYQGPVDGMLNYPYYYTLNDIYAYGKSAYAMREKIDEVDRYFSDVDALGVFVDNHDNERFLHKDGATQVRLRNALSFALFTRGIPIVYYGTE